MDDEIHLRFVDSNAAAPGELRVRSKADQRALDMAGCFSTLREVAGLDGVAQDERCPLRNNIFEQMAGAVTADFLLLVILLEGYQDASGNVPFGDHPYKLAVFIKDRQTSQL